jgi:4-diphosphocytidyl-2-C-methyl-D-erythritol kinase
MIEKAYAKVNIVLKVTSKRGSYHEFFSRFVQVKNLFDTISFTPKSEPEITSKSFNIIGNFSCTIEQNTIYKAFCELVRSTNNKALELFFTTNDVTVQKRIPAFAGLGGGSSDAATFLKMCNKKFDLELSVNELAKIGEKVGADVPFFVYGYTAANVYGIGDIVKEFKEEALTIKTFTPDIEISTPKVFQMFSKEFYKEYHDTSELENLSSIELLQKFSLEEANDLFAPAIKLYPELNNHIKEGYYFSGSGSSFFKIEN